MAADQESQAVDDGKEKDHESQRKANDVTVRSFPWVRAGVIVAAIGVTITLLIGTITACQSQSQEQPGIEGNSGNVVVGDSNIINVQEVVQRASSAAGDDDAKFKQELKTAPGADQAPTGEGPWLFTVVDSGTDGLLARDSNVAAGSPVGHSANRGMIWVDCVATTTFTPTMVTGENNVGPKWAQIRWRHRALPTDRGISDPKVTQIAWMYLGGLAPVGHNGQVKSCGS
ncbi:hypothetical protein [Amycolatopsis magusensis]|uniref:hypothetical protein n=1 Tax=Amycolatopsis magusensis TaxID=882444 RepID=UPI003C2E11DD